MMQQGSVVMMAAARGVRGTGGVVSGIKSCTALQMGGVRCIQSNAQPEGLAASREAQHVFRPSTAPETGAQLTVIANGLGSILHVQCEPRASVYARSDSVVAHSDRMRLTTALVGNPFSAILRKVGGGPLYYQSLSTRDAAGDALLSPPNLGDVAILELDGKEQYFVRPSAPLAYSTTISAAISMKSLDPRSGLGTLRVSGHGQLAITAPGGIFRLELQEGETYVVSKKHVIAWHATMTPELAEEDKPQADVPEVLPWWRRAMTSFQKWYHRNDMYNLYGPGEFFLTSRAGEHGKVLSSLVNAAPTSERVVTITQSPLVSEGNHAPPAITATPNKP